MTQSPELAGGAGFTYADQVATRYLAALLAGSSAPGLPDRRVVRVALEQRDAGEPLDEPYIFEDTPIELRTFGSVTVPEGRLWVMGDHRELSYDSRSHRGDPGGGTIPIDRVIGRAFVIVWPLDRLGTLPIPSTFKQPALEKAGAAALPAAPYALGILCTLPFAYLRRRHHYKP